MSTDPSRAPRMFPSVSFARRRDPLANRLLLRKTLKLNFWRPGDEYSTSENEIRYGVPGGVDYEWVYR